MPRLQQSSGKTSRRSTRAPIAPGSVLRLARLWPHARRRHDRGEIWRVGYYCRHCGLDTIWLVDHAGKYSWTVDMPFLRRHFDLIGVSDERSVFGKGRPQIQPLGAAGQFATQKA